MIQKLFSLRFWKSKKEIRIEPFLAFGNNDEIYVKGRVISSNRQPTTSSRNSILKNIIAAFRRYSISAIPDVEVEIVWEGNQYLVTTNQDGVFDLRFEAKILEGSQSELIYFKFHKTKSNLNNQVLFKQVSRFDPEKAIISDVDDTVLISHSTDIGKKFWLSISKNSITRRPLPGASKFYRALSQSGSNPIFYISSSDWSLFDLIDDFLNFRRIPQGPILLKDHHINLKNILKSGRGSHHHKLDKIMLLLELFPKTKFLLIGDSGQHDPELYAEIKQKYPDRILGIFIRLVGKLDEERRNVLKSEISLDQFFFIESSDEAIEIAEQQKFITAL